MLSLFTLLAVLPSCGDEPRSDEKGDGGPNGGDTGTETGSELPADNTPVSPLTQLVNKTYVLKIDKTAWTKPSGTAGEELGGFTPTFAFTISAVDEVAMTFTGLLGIAKDDGTQDTCNKTYPITGTLDNATGSTTFTITTQPADIQAIIVGPDPYPTAKATLRHFTLTGQFQDQGAKYKYGTLESELDGREIFNLFVLMDPVPANPDQLCSNLYSLGTPCEACTFEPATTYCLGVKAEAIKVQTSPTLTIVAADFCQ